jgi:hypothetical protein
VPTESLGRAIRAFDEWWESLSAEQVPRAGTDSKQVLLQGYLAGYQDGYSDAY